jgi:hypothetical protein
MTKLKIAAAVFGLSVAALAAAPASAAPVASNSVALKAAAASDVISVASKKSKKVYRGGYYYNGYNGYNGVAPGWGGPDTVGSLGYDGHYYAYNRFSGQQYYSCMLDLGYGRVRPCDAGSR